MMVPIAKAFIVFRVLYILIFSVFICQAAQSIFGMARMFETDLENGRKCASYRIKLSISMLVMQFSAC